MSHTRAELTAAARAAADAGLQLALAAHDYEHDGASDAKLIRTAVRFIKSAAWVAGVILQSGCEALDPYHAAIPAAAVTEASGALEKLLEGGGGTQAARALFYAQEFMHEVYRALGIEGY